MADFDTELLEKIGVALVEELRATAPSRTGALMDSLEYVGDGNIQSLDYGLYHIPQLAIPGLRRINIGRLVREVFENGSE